MGFRCSDGCDGCPISLPNKLGLIEVDKKLHALQQIHPAPTEGFSQKPKTRIGMNSLCLVTKKLKSDGFRVTSRYPSYKTLQNKIILEVCSGLP